MAEDLILVGAGDHGRGVLEIVRRLDPAGESTRVVSFVDDNRAGEAVDGVPVDGGLDWLCERLRAGGLAARVLLALADPVAKKRIDERLREAGARFARLAHPTAEVAPSADLAEGSVLGAGAVVVYEARVGRHVTVNLNATVGHHVRIGDHSTVAPGANILGKVCMGDGVQIHANAVVLPGVSIGSGAVVGAGAVVVRDVAPDTTVFGNPARPLPVGS